MQFNRPSKIISLILSFILGAVALAGALTSPPNGERALAQSTAPAADGDLYLPLALGQFPPPPSLFGIQFTGVPSSTVLQTAQAAGNYWVRWELFDWNKIQPDDANTPYDWSSVPEARLKEAVYKGMKVIAVIKNVPPWARVPWGKVCGPVNSYNLPDYAKFVQAAVNRYKDQIQYWELGNEPDVAPNLVPEDSAFGCWGDPTPTVTDYGGGYYATMLSYVAPAIRAADPNAKILIGGLLLDCDPTVDQVGCRPGNFFDGILKNGGAQYFDIVSFHGYPLYDGSNPIDENFGNWGSRGGVVAGKIDFLREVMANNHVDKPIFHTENALLCPETLAVCASPPADFYEDQADYVVEGYLRDWYLGMQASIWFGYNSGGWRHSGMLDTNNQPKPAYEVYDHLTAYMQGAQVVDQISGYPGLQGYRFVKGTTQIWAVWSADGNPHAFTLPAGTVRVLDKYGNVISFGGTINRPVFIEVFP